jgi:predicted enzyme related to lactoylglutathione lyase
VIAASDIAILSMTPVLRVGDAERSLAFYRNLLGFKREWEHQFEPGLPRLIYASREGYRLLLSEYPQAPPRSSLYFFVDDLDAVHELAVAGGANIVAPPQAQPYGHEMRLLDPDGNELRFGVDVRG